MKTITLKTNITICSPEELDISSQRLAMEARQAALISYAPYSNFHVGAAILLDNGKIIRGNNQENAAYPSGLCAERTALFYAHSRYPDISICKIAIAAWQNGEYTKRPVSPCGACRQVMAEYAIKYNMPIQVILCGTENVYIIDDARELLPLSFEL